MHKSDHSGCGYGSTEIRVGERKHSMRAHTMEGRLGYAVRCVECAQRWRESYAVLGMGNVGWLGWLANWLVGWVSECEAPDR